MTFHSVASAFPIGATCVKAKSGRLCAALTIHSWACCRFFVEKWCGLLMPNVAGSIPTDESFFYLLSQRVLNPAANIKAL